MEKPDWAGPLGEAYRHAVEFLAGLPERPVGAAATLPELRAALGGPVPEGPSDPAAVVAALAAAAEPGLVATPSGRFFGFVMGGATPAALAADWLTSTWDQNAFVAAVAPAAVVAEEVAAAWLAELLGLPAGVSAGFVTGAQSANLTCLAAARHEVLRRAGWDVETQGLAGAPPVRVVVGEEHHSTIDRAVRFLGLGTASLVPVDVDDQGRMLPAALRSRLTGGPTIVCAEVGNVNTGSIDPVGEICDLAHAAGAWVHVDGAFGLWAAASPRLRPLVAGVERADSWATDAHKWLNVPYDCGLAFCAHPEVHRAAMGVRASYILHADGDVRDPFDHTPEASRRARGFPVYAAIRALGRSGIAELVDRCCALARRFADRLAGHDGVKVLNQVVLNQVLVRVPGVAAGEVVTRVQREGTCWVTPTTWRGEPAIRISVSN
jgi:glutamate/tyrosine decarboxylase-like PLP-dependent enzyme